MNESEKRELNVWLHEALGNCAHVWTYGIQWDDRGKYLSSNGDLRAACKKCGTVIERTREVFDGPQAPDYCGKDWPALAEAMMAEPRRWHVYIEAHPAIQIVRVYTHSGHKLLASIRVFGTGFEKVGEAAALAARQALEAEVTNG